MDLQANVEVQLSLAVYLRYVPRRSSLFKMNLFQSNRGYVQLCGMKFSSDGCMGSLIADPDKF